MLSIKQIKKDSERRSGEDCAKTKQEAQLLYPGCYTVVKVCGGWLAFETIDEYETWKKQK
jgi:hypothetical protein